MQIGFIQLQNQQGKLIDYETINNKGLKDNSIFQSYCKKLFKDEAYPGYNNKKLMVKK